MRAAGDERSYNLISTTTCVEAGQPKEDELLLQTVKMFSGGKITAFKT